MALTVEEILAVQAAYAVATRAGDAEALAAISSSDAVVWHNFDDVEVSSVESGLTLAWLHRKMPDVTWTDVAVLPTPSGFVWQTVLTGTGPGGPVRAPTCTVVTLTETGQVTRSEEYLDPAALAGLASSPRVAC